MALNLMELVPESSGRDHSASYVSQPLCHDYYGDYIHIVPDVPSWCRGGDAVWGNDRGGNSGPVYQGHRHHLRSLLPNAYMKKAACRGVM